MYPNVSVCWGLWEWFYVRLSLKRHIYRDLSGVGRDYMIAKLTIYKSVDISKDINKKTNSITYSYKWTPQCYQLVTFYSKKKRDVCNLSNTLQYVPVFRFVPMCSRRWQYAREDMSLSWPTIRGEMLLRHHTKRKHWQLKNYIFQ